MRCKITAGHIKKILCLATMLIIADVAVAQDNTQQEALKQAQQSKSYKPRYPLAGASILAMPRYEHLTRHLIKDDMGAFDYEDYRSQYALTKQYDPIGEDTRAQLVDLAYKIKNGRDPKVTEAAKNEYEALLMAHLANLAVVLQALLLSEQDERLGLPMFLARVKNGLFESIKRYGDGRTLSSAYRVITLAEEEMLLKSLPVKVLETTYAYSGMLYFNMHQVEDLETGRRYTIFVDITRPMTYLVQKENDRPRAFSLR